MLKRFLNRVGEYEAKPHGALHPRRWFPSMTCSICGAAIKQWQCFNWDHDLPMARGGRRGKVNKRYAHVLCNTVKGDRWPFSMRTPAEREAVRRMVTPRVYLRLRAIWNGEPG